MNKVVFITGASSGIGKAIGEFLLSKDFKVYGTSRNPENIKQSKIELVALDVRNTESIHNAPATVLEKEGKIDVLINNAGVGITGPLEEIPLNEIKNNFERFFENKQVFHGHFHYFPHLKSFLILHLKFHCH